MRLWDFCPSRLAGGKKKNEIALASVQVAREWRLQSHRARCFYIARSFGGAASLRDALLFATHPDLFVASNASALRVKIFYTGGQTRASPRSKTRRDAGWVSCCVEGGFTTRFSTFFMFHSQTTFSPRSSKLLAISMNRNCLGRRGNQRKLGTGLTVIAPSRQAAQDEWRFSSHRMKMNWKRGSELRGEKRMEEAKRSASREMETKKEKCVETPASVGEGTKPGARLGSPVLSSVVSRFHVETSRVLSFKLYGGAPQAGVRASA